MPSRRLTPDVHLAVRLSAICSRNMYTSDPGPVLEELRAVAGGRDDILAAECGRWAGFYDDEYTHVLCAALLEIPGADEHVAEGQRRRGYVNHAFIPERRKAPSPDREVRRGG